MISHVLTAISLAVEAAGLSWAGFDFDGSSVEREVAWFPVDPDAPRSTALMVGLEWNTPPTESLIEPLYGVQRVTVTNPLTGAVVVERPLEREARLCRVHLYMRETRAPKDRTLATRLQTAFQDCEARILNTLSRNRRDWRVTVDGVERGFTAQYVPTSFPASQGLELHGVYSYRLHYPVLDPARVSNALVPHRINLITGEPVRPPRDLGNTAAPVTVNAPGKVSVLENP